MEQILREKVANLSDIYKQLNKDYRWRSSSNINNLIALAYTIKDKKYLKDQIDAVNNYIKKRTGPFSCYRQRSILFAALLNLNFPDPEDKFETLLEYETRLKEHGFRSYTYRPVTAYTLLVTAKTLDIDSLISKAYDIFCEMRRNHPRLTAGDDYPLSILLANSNQPTTTIMDAIEDLYAELHDLGFAKSNGLQMLSHILSLSSEKNSTKAERCRQLYQFFKDNKIKVYSSNYGTLGLLTLLENQSQKAACDVLDLSKYLHDDRSFRWLGRETLFLTATSLVAATKLESIKDSSEIVHTNAYVTIEALMAAQNAAILGATCAATSSAATSSGN
ncbi:MAG: DUF4003 domain-containing protein [Peptococcaceae bacterium]|nr:DUF4003 domain-containing protein [Peptococcaceae bacterium]